LKDRESILGADAISVIILAVEISHREIVCLQMILKAGKPTSKVRRPCERSGNDGLFRAEDRIERMTAPSVKFLRPRTVEDAVEALAMSGARILAGGTDFWPAQGERPVTDQVIDISGVQGLDAIEIQPDHFRLGGRVTWSQVIAADLPSSFDGLKMAAREVGSIQIQNAGTIAGNLCNASPAADGVPPLLVLDADVELTSLSGQRRVPVSEFITGNRRTLRRPDELLTAIIVPRRHERAASTFLKLGARRYLVISIAMVAAAVATDDAGRVAWAGIAVGACSAVAKRLPDLEKTLAGAPAKAGIGTLVRPEHLRPLTPIDDIRATASYRQEAVRTLVARSLETIVAGD